MRPASRSRRRNCSSPTAAADLERHQLLSIVMVPVLITAAELKERLASVRPPIILDVRWALGMTDGHERYLEAHVPGAVYVDLETELAAPAASGRGRHPLPDVEALQAGARRWGIDTDSAVVAYDSAGNLSAARAWWLLRWGGLQNVRGGTRGLARGDGHAPPWRPAHARRRRRGRARANGCPTRCASRRALPGRG